MKVLCAALCAALLTVAGGCGHGSRPSPPAGAPPAATTSSIPPVGEGCMGACRPTAKVGATPQLARGRPRVPDVSEYQAPVTGHVPTVIRLYEAGTNLEDRAAATNAVRLHAWHEWFAGYAFLRPGSCVEEADRTVQIVHGVGGLDGPVIADAEVPLEHGFVKCFLERVHRLLPRYPEGTYTSCGTVSEVVLPLWVADYGVSVPCTPFGDPYIAWQDSDGAFCGEREVTDCSLAYGILRLHIGPAPLSPARKRALRRYWARERAQALAEYHRLGCGPGSRGPRCSALRAREHALYLDIERRS